MVSTTDSDNSNRKNNFMAFINIFFYTVIQLTEYY